MTSELRAQAGQNFYWPVRGGRLMYWEPNNPEPVLSLVQQLPLGFHEGYGVFSSRGTPTKLIGDATGIRYGNGAYVNGSRQRVPRWIDLPCSTSQQVMVPHARDTNIVYYASAPDCTGRADAGGYLGYHLCKIDIRAGSVQEIYTDSMSVIDSYRSEVDRHGTEIISAASFPALNRVWIVWLFHKFNSHFTFADDSMEIHAYRMTDGVLSSPVVSSFPGASNGTSKFIFSESGLQAYFLHTVLKFDPQSGSFAIDKTIDTTGGMTNIIENGIFSPSGRCPILS